MHRSWICGGNRIMALIIKASESYTDKSQVIHTQGYFRVLNFTYQKDSELMGFYFLGYPNKEAREKLLPPFEVISFNVTGDDYLTWFSPNILLKDTNLEAQAYKYIIQLKDESDNLIYGNIFEAD